VTDPEVDEPHRRETVRPSEAWIRVPRTARYWTLEEEEEGEARELWIVLHGYKQLARRFLRRFTPVHDGARRIVAPEGLSRFYLDQAPGRHGPSSVVGATWMTREDRLHEIRDYVEYLDRLLDEVAPAVGEAPLTILGFSQGVATAARWVVQGRARPVRLVAWGDTLPPDLDMKAARRALEGVELVLVRGSRDGAVEGPRVEEERSALRGAGIPYREVGYEGGHDIHPQPLRELAGAVPDRPSS
jgi:predicted esterase